MKTFSEFLTEKVLSIGFNPKHEKYREQHRKEIHNILHKSYAPIGGYGGVKSGSKEESEKIHDDIKNLNIKAVRRNGKVTAVSLYRDQHGRKTVGAGTDGSDQGKKDWRKTAEEDNKQKRSWGEVSGAPEHIKRKLGVPVVHNKHAAHLTGKEVKLDKGGERYTRKIGDHEHSKVIMGHPKLS